MSLRPELSQLLQELGFTTLEAEIYEFLLQHSPATGYKIAKGIGRSFTNTYKAMESMRTKGAVLVEEGTSRLSRAVPVEELLDQLETRFRQNRALVISAANELPLSVGDNGIYHLTSTDQVYERYRQMLNECDERALGELSPEPCAILDKSVAAAGKRGLKISIRTYLGETLDHVRTVHSPIGRDTINAVQSQWLSLFVDGRQFMIAHLATGSGEVLEAVWSSNMYLAREMYAFVNTDLFHYSFAAHLTAATTLDEVREQYQRLEQEFPPGGDLGFHDLVSRITSRDSHSHSTLEKD